MGKGDREVGRGRREGGGKERERGKGKGEERKRKTKEVGEWEKEREGQRITCKRMYTECGVVDRKKGKAEEGCLLPAPDLGIAGRQLAVPLLHECLVLVAQLQGVLQVLLHAGHLPPQLPHRPLRLRQLQLQPPAL